MLIVAVPPWRNVFRGMAIVCLLCVSASWRVVHTPRPRVIEWQPPDAPETPERLYHRALTCYEHGRFDLAEPLFLEVVEKHVKHELAAPAANLYLDALAKEGKYKALVAAVGRFIDIPELVDRGGACLISATRPRRLRPIQGAAKHVP